MAAMRWGRGVCPDTTCYSQVFRWLSQPSASRGSSFHFGRDGYAHRHRRPRVTFTGTDITMRQRRRAIMRMAGHVAPAGLGSLENDRNFNEGSDIPDLFRAYVS